MDGENNGNSYYGFGGFSPYFWKHPYDFSLKFDLLRKQSDQNVTGTGMSAAAVGTVCMT